jgi:hypothetical protein
MNRKAAPEREAMPVRLQAGYAGTARLNVDIIESYESPVVSCLRVCV